MIGTAAAQTSAIAPPAAAAAAHTGVPLQDFQTWLGDRYGEIDGELTAFTKTIKNQFYLQATAGVIPSAIPTLFYKHISTVFALSMRSTRP